MAVTLLTTCGVHIAPTEDEAHRLADARGVPRAGRGPVRPGADRHGRWDAWEVEPDAIRLHVNEWETPCLFTRDELVEILEDVHRAYFGRRP